MNNKAKIYSELSMMSAVFGHKADAERLQIYTEYLSEYDPQSVTEAIKKISTTCKFFPSLAEIIEKIKSPGAPTDEQAVMIANKIFEAVSKFGLYQFKEAREFLGHDLWAVVERFSGGWGDLCKLEGKDVVNTKAALRDLAKAYVNNSKREFKGGEFKINPSPEIISNKKLTQLEFKVE